jgi:hypothetical protein
VFRHPFEDLVYWVCKDQLKWELAKKIIKHMKTHKESVLKRRKLRNGEVNVMARDSVRGPVVPTDAWIQKMKEFKEDAVRKAGGYSVINGKKRKKNG